VNAAYETLFTAEALSVCESRQHSIAALFSDMLLEQKQLQQQQQEQRQECQSENDCCTAIVPVVAAATLLLRFEQARLVSKHLIAAVRCSGSCIRNADQCYMP
jgi:hypothetical protein